jgi:hypothetical protein
MSTQELIDHGAGDRRRYQKEGEGSGNCSRAQAAEGTQPEGWCTPAVSLSAPGLSLAAGVFLIEGAQYLRTQSGRGL